jgi:hypothetical protein
MGFNLESCLYRQGNLEWCFQSSLVLNTDVYVGKLKAVLGKFKDQERFAQIYERIDSNAKWIEKNMPEVEAWLDAEMTKMSV